MAKMIYVDGLGLVEGHFSGVGQYILGILQGLDQIIEEQKQAGQEAPSVYVIIPRGTVEKFEKFGFKHLRHKVFPLSFRTMSGLWYRNLLPPIDLWCGRGVYLFPRFVSMPLAFSKSALVVFDLSYELFRQYSDEKNANFLSKGVRRSIKNNRKVITISQNAKNELKDFYSIPESKLAVATPAVDSKQFYRRSKSEIERVKQKYGIKGDYIIALSNLEPRKNLDGLVDAFCSLPKELTNKTGLLLVGVNGWKIETLFDKIVEKVAEGYNIFRPSEYVADADKPAIISGAKLLVYPSHYEGFGMPPLEALACGVPVITSDNSSLPEVTGGLAPLIPSTDIPALRDAIEDALNHNEALSKRIVVEGPKQAETFSWRNSAQVVLDALQEVAK